MGSWRQWDVTRILEGSSLYAAFVRRFPIECRPMVAEGSAVSTLRGFDAGV